MGKTAKGPSRFREFISRVTFDVLSVSEERKAIVETEIIRGSTPQPTFYILISIASLIAAFGLTADSPAVVIGAMLVSPLMTPIFGISLALVRGDGTLLRPSLISELGGVILALLVATCVGVLPISIEVTTEMVARTQPTLLDLLVATLAGLAGCLAMIDERISPVLPGIAISTSLLPPLSTSGMCVALGAYGGAYGAFLLFFANFLAILTVSAAVFIASGFVSREEMGTRRVFLKRFSGAAVGLLVVIVLLTQALVGIIHEKRLEKKIESVIHDALSTEPGTSFDNVAHRYNDGKLEILADITAPKVFSPDKVHRIQDRLNAEIGVNTNLIVRCGLSHNISATGCSNLVATKSLEGGFLQSKLAPGMQVLQMAEQALREMLIDRSDVFLEYVDLLQFPSGPVILAGVQSSRTPIPFEVQQFERVIQERLDNPRLHLLMRCNKQLDVTAKGRILYGWSHFGMRALDQQELQHRMEAEARAAIEAIPDMFATNVDARRFQDDWSVRAEVVGDRVLTAPEVSRMEQRISKALRLQVRLFVWSRAELMVTRDGLSSLQDFTRRSIESAQTAGDRNGGSGTPEIGEGIIKRRIPPPSFRHPIEPGPAP